jgi:hypothetical protein
MIFFQAGEHRSLEPLDEFVCRSTEEVHYLACPAVAFFLVEAD